ncbi:ankyrin repeat domain-containing protein [Vibrio kyushuensis]|uniref:hypothetical protein n=1 Tax=Vibrio kyushuensis TaxID=2910249 RepID=UPI003D0FFE37
MPYIDKSALASPAQLPKLAESGWFEKTCEQIRSVNIEPKQLEVLELEFTLEQLQQLCNEGEYLLAAKRCIEEGYFETVSREIIHPLLWAVEHNQLQFVFCLLALGEDVNQINPYNTSCALTLAWQLRDRSIFNLLLLHPDIDIYVEGSDPVEHSEIRNFQGGFDDSAEMYPIVELLRPEYFCCHRFLEVDWDHYIGNGQHMLIDLCYEHGELDSVKMLIALGADINPYLEERWPQCYFIHQLKMDAEGEKSSNSAKALLKFYGQFYSSIFDEGFEKYPTNFELFMSGSEQLIEETGLKEIRNRIQTEKDKLNHYVSSSSLLPAQSGSANRVKISLFNDLERLGRVKLNENVYDLVYEKRHCEHWFAVQLNNRPFPIAVSVPEEHAHYLMAGELEIPHHRWTEYQAFYHLLNMTTGYWFIEHLFNKAGCSVVKRIDEQYVLSLSEYHMIDGLLRSQEMVVHPQYHKEIQMYAGRMESFQEQVLMGLTTQISLYNSLAESLYHAYSDTEQAQIRIDQDELEGEVVLSFGSCEPVHYKCLSQALYQCIDLVKNSDRAAKCVECDEYSLVENLLEGKVHPECYE